MSWSSRQEGQEARGLWQRQRQRLLQHALASRGRPHGKCLGSEPPHLPPRRPYGFGSHGWADRYFPSIAAASNLTRFHYALNVEVGKQRVLHQQLLLQEPVPVRAHPGLPAMVGPMAPAAILQAYLPWCHASSCPT